MKILVNIENNKNNESISLNNRNNTNNGKNSLELNINNSSDSKITITQSKEKTEIIKDNIKFISTIKKENSNDKNNIYKNEKFHLLNNMNLNTRNYSKDHSNHRHFKHLTSTEKRVSKPIISSNDFDSNNKGRTHIRIKSSPLETIYASSSLRSSSPIKFNITYHDNETTYYIKSQLNTQRNNINNNSFLNSSDSLISGLTSTSNNSKSNIKSEINNFKSNTKSEINDSKHNLKSGINDYKNNINNNSNSNGDLNKPCKDCSNNKKSSPGINNDKVYHTKCPKCNTSFDVLPTTSINNDDDSDSALSSHSSLSDKIDKVIESKNKKKKKYNLSNDSLTSLPEDLQQKIKNIIKKKHLLSKKDHSYSDLLKEFNKKNNQNLKSEELKKNNEKSNQNLTSEELKSDNNNQNTNELNNSTKNVSTKSTKSMNSQSISNVYINNKEKIATIDSLNSNLENNPDKLSRPISTNITPLNDKSLIGSKKSITKSNPKISCSRSQNLSDKPNITDNVITTIPLKSSNNSKYGSVLSNLSKKQPPSTTSYFNTKPTLIPLNDLDEYNNDKNNNNNNNNIKQSNASLNSLKEHSLKCDVIPVTSTIHINKSTPSSASIGINKCEVIPVTSTVHINKSTVCSFPSPSVHNKSDGIPGTSININKSTPESLGNNHSVNKKSELEIDHISVYPIPFGCQQLYNVPILPISDKYEFDDVVANGNKKNNSINPLSKTENKDENKNENKIENHPINENEKVMNYDQDMNGLIHDLTSSFDSESSDIFLLNEVQDNNVANSKTNLKSKTPNDKNNIKNDVVHSNSNIITPLGNSQINLITKNGSSIHGSMNPITAQLLKEVRQNTETKDKEAYEHILDKDDLFGLGSTSTLLKSSHESLLKNREEKIKPNLSRNLSGSHNNLYKKILSTSLNSVHSGIFENKGSVMNSRSNLRNVTTMNYSLPGDQESQKPTSNNKEKLSETFKLPTINQIYNKVSDNVIRFIQNQWKQTDGISATFQFLSMVKNGLDIDNTCNDYLIKPLIEYNSLFNYISPSWIKMTEEELEKLKTTTLSKTKNEENKRFFVMPWKLENKSINEGKAYWISIIYDKMNEQYLIYDNKNKDTHVYGVCLMIQSSILNYMYNITSPFYSKSLQEIISDKGQTTLEANINDETWKKIIICSSELNHGDNGIDNVLLVNCFVQKYETVFKDIIQNHMEYEDIKKLLSSIKFSEFNTYIEELFTISAIQYFNENNMLC
ncbi:hypothetical protein BCR32DRAFT_249290 [Anaeromyces robustus]|uniref:Uncharacterized protein n=1 Tax=Anaeromyces robustus TaxID=1754192 RepID=A0A1Y1WQM7_9FUNG|nr:hypothetical protein BCR32DRAFT_249290 [Anaeromyces robustus]|eukprot:ORX75782.1 hypothetical protein BCR32DRAFT_249290 [Anaeromyces robustus]